MMRNIYCTRSCRLKLPAFLHAIQEFVTTLCLRPWPLRKKQNVLRKDVSMTWPKTFGNMAGNMVEFHSEMFQTLPPWKLRYLMKIDGWKMRYSPFKMVPFESDIVNFQRGWAYNYVGKSILSTSLGGHPKRRQSNNCAWWMSTYPMHESMGLVYSHIFAHRFTIKINQMWGKPCEYIIHG